MVMLMAAALVYWVAKNIAEREESKEKYIIGRLRVERDWVQISEPKWYSIYFAVFVKYLL